MKFLSFLSLMLFGLALTGQMNQIEFEEYTLDNGLHVILHEDHATPIVVVSVMYHVGSKNESPERTGFAHFFEHLLFEGSKNIDRGEFDKYITNAGGLNNAYTSQDKTYYYESLPSNQLALGLWLESERMLHATVDITGVETQRQVVKEERRLRVDNQPYGTFQEESLKRAFKKHPYQWSTIGSMEHLDRATESDYVNFYNDFYTPNNAVLSIAGDLNIAEAKALIHKYFATIPIKTKDIYRPSVVEGPIGRELVDTIYDNVQLPALIYTYHNPAQGTKDFYAVSMLNKILSDGKSSRLVRNVVDEKQLALFSGIFPSELEDPGAAIVFGVANGGVNPDKLKDAIDEEIRLLQNEKISDIELQKLKNSIESDFVGRNARIAGVAESLANYHMYYGDANLVNTELNRFLAVTKEDIQEAAKKYYQEDNRVVLVYLPKQNAQ